MLFVVKRPFRNKGKVLTAGSVITEPADIKRFKGRLAEGKIILVTEQTCDEIAEYFKKKHGVDISKFVAELKGTTVEGTDIITPKTGDNDTDTSTDNADEASTDNNSGADVRPVQAAVKVAAKPVN